MAMDSEEQSIKALAAVLLHARPSVFWHAKRCVLCGYSRTHSSQSAPDHHLPAGTKLLLTKPLAEEDSCPIFGGRGGGQLQARSPEDQAGGRCKSCKSCNAAPLVGALQLQ